jgi:uncharacterized glyoxalase superfamily protein PhnB
VIGVGIHDISQRAYHDDPCEEVSLSRSGIHTLLTETPATFAAKNPLLTDWPELLDRDGTDSTDLGEIVHAMVLGTGSAFIASDPSEHGTLKSGERKGMPYTTWSGDAKAWKDAQKAAGYIVIDRETNALALQVAAKLTAAVNERFGGVAWHDKRAEQTLIWQRRLNDGSLIWCRARPDVILPDGTIVDIKTTALSMSDPELGRRIALDGLDIQHAWYQDGAEAITGERPPFIFAFVLTVPPYSVRFVDLESPDVNWPLGATRMAIDVACHRFGACLKSGTWPDNPIDAKPIPPQWWVERRGWMLLQEGIVAEECA